jgi:hypothetical protein
MKREEWMYHSSERVTRLLRRVGGVRRVGHSNSHQSRYVNVYDDGQRDESRLEIEIGV